MHSNIAVMDTAGFCVAHTVEEVHTPAKIDLETGEVHNSVHELHFFRSVLTLDPS